MKLPSFPSRTLSVVGCASLIAIAALTSACGGTGASSPKRLDPSDTRNATERTTSGNSSDRGGGSSLEGRSRGTGHHAHTK